MKPKKLSNDKATSVDELQHCVKWAENNEGLKYDIVIELMCTNPLKNSKDIDIIIKKLILNKADAVIAVNRVLDQHPRRIKKILK